MNDTTILVLSISAGVYLVMGIILVSFAEPIYEYARESDMPVFTKGLFARALISYYNIKTNGVGAGWKHWGYCLSFNAGVSVTVALIIAFWAAIIIIVLYILAVIAVLMIIGVILSGSK
ncbi:MAG: hypothetical protein KC443_10595 [Anaerolineales bacterium]|nr:hypothetical protein [Anaerolineales bacterium]